LCGSTAISRTTTSKTVVKSPNCEVAHSPCQGQASGKDTANHSTSPGCTAPRQNRCCSAAAGCTVYIGPGAENCTTKTCQSTQFPLNNLPGGNQGVTGKPTQLAGTGCKNEIGDSLASSNVTSSQADSSAISTRSNLLFRACPDL